MLSEAVCAFAPKRRDACEPQFVRCKTYELELGVAMNPLLLQELSL
jgi:hypothetical protein